MCRVVELWERIESQCTNGTLLDAQLEKIDTLVFSENSENIRTGLMLMCTLAPEYLCRYLELVGVSISLREPERFSMPILAEQVLFEFITSESIWKALYETGAFDAIEFRSMKDVTLDDISDRERALALRCCQEMLEIPAGQFTMGALLNDDHAHNWECPRHEVVFNNALWVGKYPVTQLLWEHVMGTRPSHFDGANRPVERVHWYESVDFCNLLSDMDGLEPCYVFDPKNRRRVSCNWEANGYRLLTEAEWEYAARGGNYDLYPGGNNLADLAWYLYNSDEESQPVGQKQCNGFGLCDMAGNVWEWCWDWWERDYSTFLTLRDPEPAVEELVPSNGGQGTLSSESWVDVWKSIWGWFMTRFFSKPVSEIESPILFLKPSYDVREDPRGVPTGSDRVYRGSSWGSIPLSSPTSRRGSQPPLDRYFALGFRVARTKSSKS